MLDSALPPNFDTIDGSVQAHEQTAWNGICTQTLGPVPISQQGEHGYIPTRLTPLMSEPRLEKPRTAACTSVDATFTLVCMLRYACFQLPPQADGASIGMGRSMANVAY